MLTKKLSSILTSTHSDVYFLCQKFGCSALLLAGLEMCFNETREVPAVLLTAKKNFYCWHAFWCL